MIHMFSHFKQLKFYSVKLLLIILSPIFYKHWRTAKMIIVLKPHTTEENISRVENLVKNRGLDTHVVRGTEMTIIGCIGDTTLIDPRLFEVDSSVDKVMHVQEPYKLANRAFHPEDSVIDVSGVKIGGGHLGLIAGP